jgi:hypothetical protein
MIVYVAGPYRADTPEGVTKNIENARIVGIDLWERGFTVIVPHLNTAHFEDDCACEDDEYLRGDLEILARCDAMVVLPGYENSSGTKNEIAFAQERGIPISFYPIPPCKSNTEERRPEQCAGFIDIVMGMYRVHLAKNADYSPANILGCGSIGIVTRIWDKVSRLMNLCGFRLEIASSRYEAPLSPKNESIDDNIQDLGVYSIIWQLFRKGVWGK